MIRIGGNPKVGEYYIKRGGVYVIGSSGDVEVLRRAYVEGEVVAFPYGGFYHLLDFRRKVYKKYSSLDHLIFEYPQAVLYKNVQPKKVYRKTVLLDKRMLVAFVVLLLIVTGLGIFTFSKRSHNVEQLTQIQEEPPPPTPAQQCLSNLIAFFKKFDYGDTVKEGMLVKNIDEDTFYSFMLETTESNKVGKVVLNQSSVLGKVSLEDRGSDVLIKADDYDACLYFIHKNKTLPLVIESLDSTGCSIKLSKACINS